MSKSVLITGVTGFLGRYLSRLFSSHGWSINGLGLDPPENAPQELDTYHQMVLPCEALTDTIQQARPQVCLHCAGRASVNLSFNDPEADFKTNVGITFDILDTLRLHAPQCRLVYLSSAAVYGNPQHLPINESSHLPNPISPYGFHKLMGEQLCVEFFKMFGLPTAIVRIFSAYGAGLRRQVIWDICEQALTRSRLTLRGTGRESRDFIHAKDVARAILLLVEKGKFTAEVYNLAGGRESTIGELAQLIVAQINNRIPIDFDGKNPTGNPINWRADLSRLRNLGFFPEITLEQGIKTFVEWCKIEVLGQ
jgi:UDP-glucose 4-epimerase